MERQVITYQSDQEWLDLRTKDITSSEVSALFGLNKYTTLFELWHAKKNKEQLYFEDNEDAKWGRRFEPTIAEGLAEDNGWKIEPFKTYITIPNIKIGSSFDYKIIEPFKSILEIKKVNQFIFADEWIKDDDGNYEAPTHIEIQIQHQMLVSGYSKTFLGGLIGGNKPILLERNADKEIQDMIIQKCAEFWKSIEENKEPKPDFKRDLKAIQRLYGYAEPGSIYEADEEMLDMVKTYYTLGQEIKSRESVRDEIKGKILTQIGESEKVLHPMFSITAGTVGPADVAYHREGYRMFRINPKKELKEML